MPQFCHRLRFAVLLFLPLAAWPQESQPQTLQPQASRLMPFSDERGLPAGLRVNRVSAYFGGFDLAVPVTDALGTSTRPLGTVFGGGWSADFGWYVPGRRTAAFVDYAVAYDGNLRYSGLNGFDHALSLGLQTKLTPRVTFTLDANAESATFAEFLFGPSGSLALGQQSSTPGQIGAGLAGSVTPVGVTSSPLAFTLFGARRRDASGGFGLVFSQSPRTFWHVSARGLRSLPTESRDALGGSLVFPGVTTALVAAGLTYSWSRQTEIGFDVDYSRSYSSFTQIQIGSASASLSRVLGRQWFLHLRGGYGVMSELRTAMSSPLRRDYNGGGGIGTKVGANTFVATVRRGIADSYGLGAANTTGAEMAWIWHRPNGNWTVESAASYERLAGRTIQVIQGWLGQASVTRRLSRRTSVTAQAVYASDSGHYSAGGFTGLTRRGVRLSINWTPGVAPGK